MAKWTVQELIDRGMQLHAYCHHETLLLFEAEFNAANDRRDAAMARLGRAYPALVRKSGPREWSRRSRSMAGS